MGEQVSRTLEVAKIFIGDPFTAFSAVRVYALRDRGWPLAVLTFMLAMARVAINLIIEGDSFIATSSGNVIQFTRIPTLLQSIRGSIQSLIDIWDLIVEINDEVAIYGGVSSIVSDAIVILTTWRRAGVSERQIAEFGGNMSLLQILIRDATFTTSLAVFEPLVSSITPILISRLMIHLQEACFDPDDPSGIHSTARAGMQSTIQFQSPVRGSEQAIASTFDGLSENREMDSAELQMQEQTAEPDCNEDQLEGE
ncbi:hypothetical protein WOLCODRAFT_167736 [Wolfiporia cocos MD-104 SS10]|uniref:Uncharacterized protein n=1 Tax=Wolfiporia cocos (strain MD-104) TaxID=742152 RepID=A0A2H3J9U4_WOLCO|nr:hypothetical protein WOLCODRAFT_167736 [Wolfiporia cocos MD-104 SS10]